MILKDTLKKVAESQKADLEKKAKGVKRNLLINIDLKIQFTTIISGVRRCGKSTLLKQISEKKKKFCYFNFEDQRVSEFKLSDFEKLDEALHEIYGSCDLYLFDEIQNVDGWERYIRKMHDLGKKIIITGSNASLLSRELGTKLTGRHITRELFPFSYKEMLELTKQKPSIQSFEKYFKEGGFPDYLKYKKIEIVQQVFKDILFRDIIVRYNLRDKRAIQDLAVYLLTNIGKEFSYNKLRAYFNLGSTNSAISYVSHFEDSYLMFTVPKFDYSLKKQIVNPKKIYSIDVGLSRANSITFSEDKGRILENIVYIHLRRANSSIFYFNQENECDFLIKQKEKIVQAVQVCYRLDDDNKDREFNGLLDALKEFKLKKGLIITYDQEDKIKLEGREIIIKPAWKWLLE